MTLQSSGPITLQQISVEFSGPSTNIQLQSFYAGGSYVPAGTLNGSGVAIPSSGAIKLQDFYGASAVVINGGTYSIYSQGPAGGNSSGSITFNADGTITHTGSGSVQAGHYTGPTAWASPGSSGIGSNYQFIVDSRTLGGASSDSYPSSGTWIGMGSGIGFSFSNSGNQGGDYVFSCRIRNATTLVVVSSLTVDMSYENT